jgi:two-component system OmpR family response regulator
MRILIIFKDNDTAKLLETELNRNKFTTVVVNSLEEAQKRLETAVFNLILVHWSVSVNEKLLAFIHSIKNGSKKSSLIVFDEEKNKLDEIIALNGGADDFVKLPLIDNQISPKSLSVLYARMDARLRFGGTNVIAIDDLVIDPDEEKIFYLGKEIELKGKPFEVLTHLAKHSDQIVSKEQLLDAIWEEPELVTPNVIEVAINQIRQKMDKPLNIGTIETVRRRGYRFCFPNCTGES